MSSPGWPIERRRDGVQSLAARYVGMMTFPSITAFWAGILGLIYVAMAVWVMAGRVTGDTLFGDGGDEGLSRRIRSHGNFQEYVPISLVLIALLEAGGGSATLVRTLLILLVVARLLHPVGLFAGKNTPLQFACRGGGIITTLLVILISAVDLLIR